MARSFSSGNYIHRMSPADWTPAGAIAFWFKPTWSTGDHQILRLYKASPLGLFDLTRVASGSKYYIGWYNAPTDSRIALNDPGGLFTPGVWAHHFIQWAATGAGGPLTVWYIDGVQKAVDVSTGFTIPTSMGEWRIGEDPIAGVGADGDIAEFGRWGSLRSAPQIARLVEGYRPNASIDGLSTDLLEYAPILGVSSPEPELVSGADLAVVGSPAHATHPPLIDVDQTLDPPTIAATVAVPSPAVDMTLGVSPLTISAGVSVPSPVVTSAAFALSPSSVAAVVTVPSPGVNFLIPKGLTVTVSDRLAAG